MRTPHRFLPRLCLAAAAAGTVALAVTAPAGAAGGTSTTTGAATSVAAITGGSQKIGGEVEGLTGAAAAAVAGDDLDTYRTLAQKRILAAGVAGSSAAGAAAAALEHPARGTYLRYANGKGVQANHSVFNGTGSRTHGQDVVYAPTLMPSGGSCIEMTTAYTSSGPVLWAWAWCGRAAPAKTVPIDANFLATYTRNVGGQQFYTVDIHQTATSPNTWTAYLFNFRTGAWDVFHTQSGTFTLAGRQLDGWDIFELYFSRDAAGKPWYCSTMTGRTISMAGLQVKVGSTWQAAKPGVAQVAQGDLGCAGLSWSAPDLSQWTATLR